jgi:hypothetical protein
VRMPQPEPDRPQPAVPGSESHGTIGLVEDGCFGNLENFYVKTRHRKVAGPVSKRQCKPS